MRAHYLTTFILLLLLAPCAQANPSSSEDWFSIEYIIFENNLNSTQQSEPWTGTSLAPIEEPIYIDSAEAFEHSIIPLPLSELQLHGAFRQLSVLTAYTPIRHAGWIQAAQKGSKKIKLSLSPAIENNLLEGTLSFHRGRFLHLDISLQLSQPSSPFEDPILTTEHSRLESKPTLFKLEDTRRINTGKINYFDHPRFGLIVIINKIDSPWAVPEQAPLLPSEPSQVKESSLQQASD